MKHLKAGEGHAREEKVKKQRFQEQEGGHAIKCCRSARIGFRWVSVRHDDARFLGTRPEPSLAQTGICTLPLSSTLTIALRYSFVTHFLRNERTAGQPDAPKMARPRRASTTSSRSVEQNVPGGQEMGSMYDYLAKVILLGPSGCGKSCLLHRFIKGEWRVLTSQTIGVEFASRIVKVGTPGRRKRVKLQLWDTAGTERFRSVSRSYYRGAAGAILVYDICDQSSFAQLPTFLNDARALASPQLTVVLAGNKADLAEPSSPTPDLLESETSSQPSTQSTGTLGPGLGSQQKATTSPGGRAVAQTTAASWASQSRIPATMEVSALSGDGVDEVFNKLARTILTKIELGEIDPDDPMSGIQYGDADYYRDDGSSIKSGLTAETYATGRRRRRGDAWADVFRLGRSRNQGSCC